MTLPSDLASNPQFSRLLRKKWGADLSGLDPESATSKDLFGIVSQQSTLIQQLVEELASFMGKSSVFNIFVPQEIDNDPTRIGRGTEPVNCGEGGVSTFTVSNPSSKWDNDLSKVVGGHTAIFDGVVSFDTICADTIIGGSSSTGGAAIAIAFTLSGAGFGPGATVVDFYNGTDPDPDDEGVTIVDPLSLFPTALPYAKGKAVWNPKDNNFVAVEVWDEEGGGGTPGLDEKVKVSVTDQLEEYLGDKLTLGSMDGGDQLVYFQIMEDFNGIEKLRAFTSRTPTSNTDEKVSVTWGDTPGYLSTKLTPLTSETLSHQVKFKNLGNSMGAYVDIDPNPPPINTDYMVSVSGADEPGVLMNKLSPLTQQTLNHQIQFRVDGSVMTAWVEVNHPPQDQPDYCAIPDYDEGYCQVISHGCGCEQEPIDPDDPCPVTWCNTQRVRVITQLEVRGIGLFAHESIIDVVKTEDADERMIFPFTACQQPTPLQSIGIENVSKEVVEQVTAYFQWLELQ